MKLFKFAVIRVLVCVVLALGSGAITPAQSSNQDDYPKVEVFVGYSALGDNNGRVNFSSNSSAPAGYANTVGFETSVTRNFTRHIGLKGDFSAHFKNDSGNGLVSLCNPVCITATQDIKFKTRVYNFLAGPEFKPRNSTRVTPFAHILGGLAHTSANFTTQGPPLNLSLGNSHTNFAMALGGGLDIRATKRVSFRGQMDYNPVFIPNSTFEGRRDFVRISLGVLFH